MGNMHYLTKIPIILSIMKTTSLMSSTHSLDFSCYAFLNHSNMLQYNSRANTQSILSGDVTRA